MVYVCGPQWCMGGDFNVIRYVYERLNGRRVTRSMGDFDVFIRDTRLRDPPLGNGTFT